MTRREQKRFNKLIKHYIKHPKVQSMKEYIQHGDTTTFAHVLQVTKLSYLINRRLHLHADESILIPAALLHDFYLYDWHDKLSVPFWRIRENHGFIHADAAANNAREVFGVNDEVYEVIRSHMWPLNLTHIPKSKEAWILCIADKCVALKETIMDRVKKIIKFVRKRVKI